MGLLSRGQAFLNRTLKASEGVAVTYSRVVGANTYSVALTARAGRTLFSGLQESEIAVQWGEGDVLIEAADLILNGSLTTPQRGDRVSNFHGATWDVASPETNEPAWRWSDITRTVYRVHLKRAG